MEGKKLKYEKKQGSEQIFVSDYSRELIFVGKKCVSCKIIFEVALLHFFKYKMALVHI